MVYTELVNQVTRKIADAHFFTIIYIGLCDDYMDYFVRDMTAIVIETDTGWRSHIPAANAVFGNIANYKDWLKWKLDVLLRRN